MFSGRPIRRNLSSARWRRPGSFGCRRRDRHSMDVVVDEDKSGVHRPRRPERPPGVRDDRLGDRPDDRGRITYPGRSRIGGVRVLFMEKLDVDEEVANILILARVSRRSRKWPTSRSARRGQAFDGRPCRSCATARAMFCSPAIVTRRQSAALPKICSASTAWIKRWLANFQQGESRRATSADPGDRRTDRDDRNQFRSCQNN